MHCSFYYFFPFFKFTTTAFSLSNWKPIDKNLKESNFKIVCPGIFTEKEKEEIEYGAKTIHQKIGLDFYSKIDFIVHPKRGVYFIEVNSQSEFFENSFMVQSLESVGSNLGIFLDHIISKALKKRPI